MHLGRKSRTRYEILSEIAVFFSNFGPCGHSREATFSHPDNDRLTVSETSKERAITFDLGIFDLINKSQIHLQSFEDRTQQQNATIKVNIF